MDFLDRLDSVAVFRSSMKVFVPENNLANEGSWMWNLVKNRPNIRCYWQKDDRPGVHKGPHMGEIYQMFLNIKLKNNSIYFDEELFTTTPGQTVQSIKGSLREQLERYRFEFDEAKTFFGKAKQTVTGKQGVGGQDDLAIAVLMSYWGFEHTKDVLRYLD